MSLGRVVVTGASGMIGTSLIPALRATGWTVLRLVRREPQVADEAHWDPTLEALDTGALLSAVAVIHLAGENVAAGPWTPSRRLAIRDSRVRGTRLLAEAIAALPPPRPALLAASAVGYYGDRGGEVLTEDSPPGQGFLAEVCQAWEAAADPARVAGARVAHLRLGVILSSTGGALPRFATPIRLGLGAILGNGRQIMSWVALPDVVGAFQHCLTHENITGPVNVTAPEAVSNTEFTQTLGRVLQRGVFLRAPGTMLELALGDMAREVLLASARVMPCKLQESGYRFHFPSLAQALRATYQHSEASS